MGVSEPAADMRDIVLLPSKVIVPSRAAHVVERPAVTEKLARATSCPLTAVVSPAGFGKTTAVVSWLRTLKDVPCAWYLLDAEDAALDRFWLYLVTALRRADERICQSFDDVRLPDEFSKLRLALDALIIQMTEYGRDFVCVLEDFHEVHEDAGIHESVHYLLKHLPPNAHFVVTSRQALRFPIAKMRVEGALNEVGEADLRLSVDEAGALLAGMGMRMGTEQARAVHEATGGWATGIRLVALLCGDGSRTQVDEALACARVSINDYLFEEVFSVLSAKRRRFLAATSVVGSFCLPLTERITGLSREEAAEQVDYLVRNGLFVERFERKEGEDWYRYHPLLSDLLRQRLDRADDLDAAALGAAACAWLEEHGYFDSAVEVAADRGDYARVRQIIMDNWKRLYMSDSHYTVLRWASFLPDAEILASPLLCAVLAMPFALKGESERANAYLESAIARLHDDEDFLFALCLVQKAFMASFRNDWARMRQFATQALKYLPADEFYLRSMMLQVEASSSAAFDLLGAKAAFAQSLGMQLDYGNKCLSSSAFCNLSRICANLGHVQESRHYAERAFALYSEQERRFKPMLGYAYLSTMLCSYEEGDLERALRARDVPGGFVGGRRAGKRRRGGAAAGEDTLPHGRAERARGVLRGDGDGRGRRYPGEPFVRHGARLEPCVPHARPRRGVVAVREPHHGRVPQHVGVLLGRRGPLRGRVLVRRCDGRGGPLGVRARFGCGLRVFREGGAPRPRGRLLRARCAPCPGLEARQRAGREPRVSAPCRPALPRADRGRRSRKLRARPARFRHRRGRGVASHRARG